MLLVAGITILLFEFPSSELLERRVDWFVLGTGLIGVAIIWFPDVFEDYENLSGQSLFDKVKPEKCEVSVGWLYILGPFVVWVVMKLV